MRPINGDELKKGIEQQFCTACDSRNGVRCRACDVGECLMYIDDAPTIETADTKAAAIMLHYGAKHQLLKLAEECAELIQQCMKCFDLDLQYSEDFVEELADARIMIMQFESILRGSWGELYKKIIEEKLERQMRRKQHDTA